MLYIDNSISTDPHFNLAVEEYVLKNLNSREEYLLLWQNEPAIIIGRHQNTLAEINLDYVQANKIHVVRRLSGGGAVYHDLGNLNFTFIKKAVQSELLDFKSFTEPVLRALDKLGVKAELSGRNDLTIAGKKFSGNAQYLYKNNILHHGTLLFASDLSRLQKALKVQTDKIESKGVKSVRSRVTNIKEHLKDDISIEEFKGAIRDAVAELQGDNFVQYELTKEDLQEIKALMEERYLSWEWNYGQSPPFNIRNWKRFAGGKVEILLEVEKGLITNCKIYGDFLGLVSLSDFEEGLRGIRYEEVAIRDYLKKQDLQKLFGSIGREELLSCLLGR
ncbi:MAG: lipoate--protein ligase [bacterium]